MISRTFPCRSFLLGAVLVPLSLLHPLASAASGQDRSTPNRPRILVLPGATGPGRTDLEREAVHFMIRELVDRGFPVVDPSRVPPTKGPDGMDRRPDLMDRADILVRIRLESLRERKQQGRYRVEDRMRIRMICVKDASIVLETSMTGKGTCFYSYRKAHLDALRGLCAAGRDALVAAEKRKRTGAAPGGKTRGKDRTSAASKDLRPGR